MSTIQVFDPALCCSSGVCGQEVDAQLVQAAADIDWAKGAGARIERFNLAQQPLAFAQNDAVRDLLERSGQKALPITVLDGQVVLAGRYPSRQQLGQWAGLEVPAAPAAVPASGCCSGGRCC
ncbi:MAG TPA: arsenite efflux transporter metallochaperone ArsD [Roseateles sp.]|nr:arsenite efflux transporter metallochaperone ArsD [Roseateles sp.]